MPLISWSDTYSVKSPVIDAQHQKLFTLVNDLHEAMLQGKGKDVIEKTLDATANYARVHFSDEEKLMTKYLYPNLAAHQEEHNAFVQKVFELQSDYRSGKTSLTLPVMNFLKDWLTSHIMKVDKQYSAYVKE